MFGLFYLFVSSDLFTYTSSSYKHQVLNYPFVTNFYNYYLWKVKAKTPPPAAAVEASGPTEPSQPADYVKTEVTVESKKIGIIIGPKGVTLHGIQGE